VTGFADLVDLAAGRLGGMVLAANDEFFAEKENLLSPLPPVFEAGRYTDRGKWMDGWETRRRRTPGSDWAVVRLGVPGVVRGVVVDTTHFRGNHPEAFSLEGCAVEGDPPAAEVLADGVRWHELVGRTPLVGDSAQRFAVDDARRVTHVRLVIHPDGGVARLRVQGDPLPDLRRLADRAGGMDLAAVVNGGQVTAASGEFFASRHNLVMVGDSVHMGDGWETRRRRGPGHDWAVVRLAATGVVERVDIDTTHYKGNHPDRCSVEVCTAGGDAVPAEGWRTVVPETRLGPHARHLFGVDDPDPATHVRLNIFPDGGVARLRVRGRVTDDGWRAWGTRWLDVLLREQAETVLRACCASTAWVAGMTARRPFGDFGALTAAADDVWRDLGAADRLEAFAAHPRIGDREGSAWSKQEQSAAAGAGGDTPTRLAAGNRVYEERFGHVFLICATGRSAEEMLADLDRRLGNDPDTELRVAAEEQRKVTRIRLEKLVRP